MGCTTSKKRSDFCININTTPAFSEQIGGSIHVTSDTEIDCEWKHNGNAALLQLSHDRKTALNVPPGVYEVKCTSDLGDSIISFVNVEELQIPRIRKYTINHASSDNARDGQITADITNLEYSAVNFLWTSGVITEEPVLHDVKPGLYTVTVISKDKIAFPCYHECPPAKVRAQENNFK